MADKIGPFLTSMPHQCWRSYSCSIFVLPPKEKLQKTLSRTAFTSSNSSLSVTDPRPPPFPPHHGQGFGKVTHDLLMPGSPAFLRSSWHSQQHLFLKTWFSFLKTLSTWPANNVASWFSIYVMDSSSPSSSFLNVGVSQDSVLGPLLLSIQAHPSGYLSPCPFSRTWLMVFSPPGTFSTPTQLLLPMPSVSKDSSSGRLPWQPLCGLQDDRR